MAIASKGSSFSLASGNGYAAIASVISLDGPGPENEHFEVRTLDGGAGIQHVPTGFVEPGTISGELYLTTSNKSAVLAAISSLATNMAATNAQVSYGSGNGAITFTTAVAGMGLTPSATVKDGVKAKFTAKASGDVT